MLRSYVISLSGKVQGVFFRRDAKQKADELGVKGFVKNGEDGSLMVEAEADEKGMVSFMSWCGSGSEQAIVESIVITEQNVKGFTSFEIEN